MKKNPQRIPNIKPFIDQYNWKEIDFPSHSKDWKKFEQNNKTIALNIIFVQHNTKKIRLAYKSKHDFKGENQVFLLMTADGKKWHYLTVKSLFALLRGTIFRDFYCLNCFHSYSTKENLKKLEKVYYDHDYYVKMLNGNNKILKYNHGEKSMRVLFVIYVDLECFLEKLRSFQNNPEKSYTEKKTKHATSGYLLFTNYSFDAAKNKLDCYRDKDCMQGL